MGTVAIRAEQGRGSVFERRLLGRPAWMELREHIVIKLRDRGPGSIIKCLACDLDSLHVMNSLLEAAPGIGAEDAMAWFLARLMFEMPRSCCFEFICATDLDDRDYGWGVWSFDLQKRSWRTSCPEFAGRPLTTEQVRRLSKHGSRASPAA